MEARTKEQLSEDLLNAAFWNAGAVVFGLKFNDVLFVVNLGDFDLDFGQDARFFAGVQRIVNGFFDRRDEGTSEGIEAEKVLVFLKKF